MQKRGKREKPEKGEKKTNGPKEVQNKIINGKVVVFLLTKFLQNAHLKIQFRFIFRRAKWKRQRRSPCSTPPR